MSNPYGFTPEEFDAAYEMCGGLTIEDSRIWGRLQDGRQRATGNDQKTRMRHRLIALERPSSDNGILQATERMTPPLCVSREAKAATAASDTAELFEIQSWLSCASSTESHDYKRLTARAEELRAKLGLRHAFA